MSNNNGNSNHKRQGLTPIGASRKRKERDGFDAPRVSITTKAEPATSSAAAALPPPPPPPPQPASGSGNRLLAGYLAHEFLTKGTLFGRHWDPAAAAARPPGAARAKEAKQKPPAPTETEAKTYADVAYILKSDGAHIPGIVNPTQLVRWLQM